MFFSFKTHLVCVVPQYAQPNITEPVTVRLCVASSGKTSESQQFTYTPVSGAVASGKLTFILIKIFIIEGNLMLLLWTGKRLESKLYFKWGDLSFV